ncbi:hypothetical protein PFMG_02902 [Plasmodium falciparum IGH-CR14]|uniref:Uncharacterized protein n=4 Tax=Plasmodium falciparum TaxID=5833 RepID=A0A0L1IBZ5_PLAFA|nr:hypothetical protein PFMG_02902 [Plasmodium falciparum IGH-CR14]
MSYNDGSEEENDSNTYIHDEKKKKKKKNNKNAYALINEVNYSQEDEQEVIHNTNSEDETSNRKGNGCVYSLSDQNVEDHIISLPEYLDLINNNNNNNNSNSYKMKKEKKKKKKEKKNQTDEENMKNKKDHIYQNNITNQQNDIKNDYKKINHHNMNNKKNKIFCQDDQNIFNINHTFQIHETVQNNLIIPPSETCLASDIIQPSDTTQSNTYLNEATASQNDDNNNEDSSNEMGMFKKIFYRIKKIIVDKKGTPITNENDVDNDMCELNVMENNMNNIHSNNNNISTHMDDVIEDESNEEVFVINRNTDGYINTRENINVSTHVTRQMINLSELNPNDLLCNVSEYEEGQNINSLWNDNNNNNNNNNNFLVGSLNALHPINHNLRNENIHNDNINNTHINYDNNNSYESPIHILSFSFKNIYNKISSYINEHITHIKEKIKKYWLERVQEANTQLNSPRPVHTRNTTNINTNININEDENDDPSCVQILFFMGLICKFPILWIIGSIVFCITPSEHRKTKTWSLVNTFFALLSIIYFITTTNFRLRKPTFFVILEQNVENKNTYPKGILKYNNMIHHKHIIIDQSSLHKWKDLHTNKVYKTSENYFLNRNFLSSQKPDSNILLSDTIYKLLNRIQVTVTFGKGNIYSSDNIEKIKPFFQNLRINMDPISYDKLTMTDEDIPDDFFGSGLRCERTYNNHNQNINEPQQNKEKEKWYLFWKEEEINNSHNKNIYNISIPVGEIFFFKSEYNCRIAFLYPKSILYDQNDIPSNFVEIQKIIIKPF